MKGILKIVWSAVKAFFGKGYVKFIALLLICFLMVLFMALYDGKRKEAKQLKRDVEQNEATIEAQRLVIDSLTAMPRESQQVCVTITIDDRSRNVVKGNRNRGTIEMPQERTYSVRIDSVVANVMKGS